MVVKRPAARRPLRSCSDSIAIAFGMSEPEERLCELVLEDNNDFMWMLWPSEPEGTARHAPGRGGSLSTIPIYYKEFVLWTGPAPRGQRGPRATQRNFMKTS